MVILVPDNKTEDDYGHWSRQIGKQSELGVQLQVAISYSDRSGPHVIATGTVGVPRPPEDDFERHLLATKIADLIEAPDIAIFSFTGLLWWRVVKGGPFQVDLTETRQLRQLDESEVSNSVSMSGPGPMSEPVFRTEFPESHDWAREYADNRYLRFDTRIALNQRYQDLITNITVLTHTGQVTLTEVDRGRIPCCRQVAATRRRLGPRRHRGPARHTRRRRSPKIGEGRAAPTCSTSRHRAHRTRSPLLHHVGPCPIHSQFRVVGHHLGGRTHRTCPAEQKIRPVAEPIGLAL